MNERDLALRNHVYRRFAELGRAPELTETAGELGLSAEQAVCERAHAWWGNRLAADWRPRTRDESQAILDRLDLTGEFWQLA